jgi:IS5 family transposase
VLTPSSCCQRSLDPTRGKRESRSPEQTILVSRLFQNKTCKAQGFKSRIHVRAARGHPLSKAKAEANRKKSRLRARVEHVFGAQQTSPGGRIVRTIGIVRARAKIGLQNLVYNIHRLVTLERMAAA